MQDMVERIRGMIGVNGLEEKGDKSSDCRKN